MQDLLFNTPWWLPTGIVVVGVVLFFMGNQRTEPKTRAAGIAVVALAMVLSLVSYLVDTPKEKCEKRTRAIVESVVKKDWPRLRSLLDQHTSFDTAGGQISQAPATNNGPMIATEAESASAAIGLQSVTVPVLESKQDQSLITVTFSAFSVQDRTQGQVVKSSWEFSWQQRGDDWFLQQITLIKIGQ
jgi:hypothetical protein